MKTLVFVGGGHAHLHCLEQVKSEALENLRVVLISPSRHQYYSGMFSGYTEGVYNLDDIRIDLAKLCEKIGCTFIKDTIVAVDAQAKTLKGEGGTVYRYDLTSFDIGSRTAIPDALKEHVSSIKPNYRFPEQLLRLRNSSHPVIVGGGAAGVELAFSIQAWRKNHALRANTILLSSTSLLANEGAAQSKKIEAIALQKKLPFFTDASVEAVEEQQVIATNGESYPQTDVLWLTGPKSDDIFRNSALPTDGDGFLLVNRALQSVGHPTIFGAGDCISIDRYPKLEKNGVYAVRQGPILWKNLKSSLSADKLIPFKPQKHFMSILSTGDGEAFLTYGKRSIHGKIPWKIKQRIDRKFMKQFKDLYE
ncbi:FAD-dependent oxidoreductase [Planococcus koreensis]|uniref:FAD-dependent oxidoreductase n=1 Tax=Planococcus koreensis TaxID=112331 RepID=UPI0039FD1050